MYPEVEEYAKAVDEAQAEYDAAYVLAGSNYNENVSGLRGLERDKMYQDFNTERRALQNIRRAKIDLAWARLGLSGDPLLRWIATQVDASYRPDHADKIVRMLPATLDQMRKVAQENEWCSDFTMFVDRAIAAGVLDDGRTPERRALETWVRDNWNARYIDVVNNLVDAILQAEAQSVVDARKPEAEPVTDPSPKDAEAAEDDRSDNTCEPVRELADAF
jgi:hypothetical protein